MPAMTASLYRSGIYMLSNFVIAVASPAFARAKRIEKLSVLSTSYRRSKADNCAMISHCNCPVRGF